MKIKQIQIDKLNPYKLNAKLHPKSQIEGLAESIKRFGFTQPIVIDKKNVVIIGHGRLEAAKSIAMIKVPCLVLESLSKAEIRALRLIDNRIAETGWDTELLELEFEDFDFDFEPFNIDFDEFIEEEIKEGLTDSDQIPDATKKRVKKGEVWKLGEHRLMCGDATNKNDVDKLLNDEKADMVFTDPPYNVDYSNASRPKPSKRDLGKIKNDVMSLIDFKEFISKTLDNADRNTSDNASIYLWYASASASAILDSFDESRWKRNQEIIWKKPMLLGRGKYQWAHEPCIFAIKGSPYFTSDRTKTTVWDFGGYNKSQNEHPTQKPTVLCEEGIVNSSEKEGIVLDLFLGSGSTLIACERTNRKCYGMEIDQHYCDIIIKRWEDFTEGKAKLDD